MIGPEEIPQRVMDAFHDPYDDVRQPLAAALAALMDDEPVWVKTAHGVVRVHVRPSDVLDAVLEREARS